MDIIVVNLQLGDAVVGGEQEAAGAAGGVANRLSRRRDHDADVGADEAALREIICLYS